MLCVGLALAGRLLLRWLVQLLHPDGKSQLMRIRAKWFDVLAVDNGRIVFARSKTNKPVLLHPPKQPFSFNISHHGDWVVLVWHHEHIVGVGKRVVQQYACLRNSDLVVVCRCDGILASDW